MAAYAELIRPTKKATKTASEERHGGNVQVVPAEAGTHTPCPHDPGAARVSLRARRVWVPALARTTGMRSRHPHDRLSRARLPLPPRPAIRRRLLPRQDHHL